MDLEPVRESGAEVVFDCPSCEWGVMAEIGGPGHEHQESVDCPNPDCDYRFGIRLEVEPE